MKMPVGAVALFILFGAVITGSGQNAGPTFSLFISLPQTEVKTGANVELDIMVKNISGGDIVYGKVVGSAEGAYNLIITDDAEKPATETPYGRKLHGKEPISDHHSAMAITLKPGESLQETIYLNEIYDLTRPGRYTVQVKRTIYATEADAKSRKKTDVKSNTAMFNLTN